MPVLAAELAHSVPRVRLDQNDDKIHDIGAGRAGGHQPTRPQEERV